MLDVWIYIAYMLLLFAAAISTLLVVLYAWSMNTPLARAYALYAGAAALIIVSFFLMYLSPTAEIGYFWTRLRFLGLSFSGVLGLQMVCYQVGLANLITPARRLLLSVIPIVTNGMVWTNDGHKLMFVERQVTSVHFLMIEKLTFGVYFQLHSLYTYLLVFASFALLIWQIMKAIQPYSRQALFLALQFLVAIVFSLPANFGLLPNYVPNFTPLGLALGTLIGVWGLFRYRLLELAPLAHALIFEQQHEGVVVLDAEQRILEVNQAAALMMQQPVKNLIGKTVREVFTVCPNMSKEERGQPGINTEFKVTIAGKVHFYELRVAPLYQNQQLVGQVVTMNEITERKQAEQEREDLIRMLDSYAHTVAHDLKNPIGRIYTYAKMLQEDLPDSATPQTQRYVYNIVSSARNSIAIIDELLLFASIRHKVDLPLSVVDMDAILAVALMRLQAQTEEAGGEIEVTAQLPAAIGYEAWLEEVWVNYLTNALKYGGTPPKITIGAAPEGDKVRYWVQDQGIGIPPDQQLHLFDQFTRLNEKSLIKGHGLGLSIVKLIVERLNGEVGVTSEVGIGSTFYFILPAVSSSDTLSK